MAGYLIGEEGPLVGQIVSFEEGDEWILGRDPETSYQVLEDPLVSRRHAIVTAENDQFSIENLSSTNPTMVNGSAITDPTEIHEGDIIQLGNTFFRFTLIKPDSDHPNFEQIESDEEEPTPEEIDEEISLLSLSEEDPSRWLIKVISGPNTGAEFHVKPGQTYVIGKDPNICDIFFQDLSVSRQHAKIIVNEDGSIVIEDLSSRNGVLVNGNLIEKEQTLSSQDLVSLGTTSFLIIDREQTRETLYSPPSSYRHEGLSEKDAEKESDQIKEQVAMRKNWKELFIPTKHLVLGLSLFAIVAIGFFSMISLFKTQTILVSKSDQIEEIEHVLKQFPKVEFNFTSNSGKLFLLGHVLTDIEHQEMIYLLRSLPFISSIDDNVIIDEYVWEDMNALLFKNPNWRSVLIVAPEPGKFVMKGYLKSADLMPGLVDYINNNFPYLDKLENKVVIENTLETEIQALLIERGFMNVTFNLASGELVLAGRVSTDNESKFNETIKQLRKMDGISEVKSYVLFAGKKANERIDISDKYKVTGTSKYGDESQFVMINGKILSKGDLLDGMQITGILPNMVQLEKDGLKYKIDYNL